MRFRKKLEGRGKGALRKFHTRLLDNICKEKFREVIANLDQEVSDMDSVCIFKEPLFTTRGAYLDGEIYKGERIVKPDLVAVYPCKENWHMVFGEFKSRPLKGKSTYIEDTKTEFHLLYDYIKNYPGCVYALFENHDIPGEKRKVPKSVIESCDIYFLGIHRTMRGISKTLSCKLPPLPKLIAKENSDKYPLIFEYA